MEKIIFVVLICYLAIGLFCISGLEAMIAKLKRNEKTREKTLALFPSKLPIKSKLKIILLWPYLLNRFYNDFYEFQKKKEIENNKFKGNFKAQLKAMAKNPPLEKTEKSNFQRKLEELASK